MASVSTNNSSTASLQPPPPPPPRPPPPPIADQLFGGSSQVIQSDSDVLSGLKYYSIGAAAILLAFVVLRKVNVVYSTRLVEPGILRRPPSIPSDNFKWVWAWIVPVLFTPEVEILRMAGLDGVMYLRMLSCSFQFFLPVSILMWVIVVPIHLAQTDDTWLRPPGVGNMTADMLPGFSRNGTQPNVTVLFENPFTSVSMNRIPQAGGDILWVHFVVAHLLILWAFFLLFQTYQAYVSLRQKHIGRQIDPSELVESQAEYPGCPKNPLWRLAWLCFPSSRLRSTSSNERAGHETDDDEDPSAVSAAILSGRMGIAAAAVALERQHPKNSKEKFVQAVNRVRDKSEAASDVFDVAQQPDSNMQLNSSFRSVVVNGNTRDGGITRAPSQNLRRPNAVESHSLGASSSMSHPTGPDLRRRFNDDDGPKSRKVVAAAGELLDAPQDQSLQRESAVGGVAYEIHKKPRVMHLRTTRAGRGDESDTVVTTSLYAVLVTGVPQLEKRRALFKTRTTLRKLSDALSPAARQPQPQQWSAAQPSGNDMSAMATSEVVLEVLGDEQGASLEPPSRDNAGQPGESDAGGGGTEVAYDIVAAVFREMFPNSFHCTVPIYNDSKVAKELKRWELTSRELEVAQARLEAYDKRPLLRLGGCCGVGGEVVDAIEHYQSEVRNIEADIIRVREEALKSDMAPSAFVLFHDQFTASVAAQSVIHPEDGRLFHTAPAPGPDDINWTALWATRERKALHRVLAVPMLAVIILFPSGFFAASISNVNYLICENWNREYSFDWYCDDQSYYLAVFKSDLLPALLLGLWQAMVMPIALYWLALFQLDSVSKSSMDRSIARSFVAWGIFNVFLGGMLGGMTRLFTLLLDPDNWLNQIGAALASAANFFIAFVQTQAVFFTPLTLVQPHAGVWFYMLARLLHKRAGGCCLIASDIQRTWSAKSYMYGMFIPLHMIVMLLGVTYSVMSPAILPYCVLYFAVYWMIRRYHTMYVYERCYESGGLMWPVFFDTFTLFLFIFGLFMAAILLTWQAKTQAALMFFSIPGSVQLFRRYCNQRFGNIAEYLPLELAYRAPHATLDPQLYIPPALRHGAVGYNRESRKTWEGYGYPSQPIY